MDIPINRQGTARVPTNISSDPPHLRPQKAPPGAAAAASSLRWPRLCTTAGGGPTVFRVLVPGGLAGARGALSAGARGERAFLGERDRADRAERDSS